MKELTKSKVCGPNCSQRKCQREISAWHKKYLRKRTMICFMTRRSGTTNARMDAVWMKFVRYSLRLGEFRLFSMDQAYFIAAARIFFPLSRSAVLATRK